MKKAINRYENPWQGRQDSNLRHRVLETRALPTELLPYNVWRRSAGQCTEIPRYHTTKQRFCHAAGAQNAAHKAGRAGAATLISAGRHHAGWLAPVFLADNHGGVVQQLPGVLIRQRGAGIAHYH